MLTMNSARTPLSLNRYCLRKSRFFRKNMVPRLVNPWKMRLTPTTWRTGVASGVEKKSAM